MTLFDLGDLAFAGLLGFALGAWLAEVLRYRAGWRPPQPRGPRGRFR